ncbi:hypothetical protein N0V83_003759 [Neocucurbitaria cava]|uniref:Uncharacterized protein n=1 Tax=Neocucurbitaria cava TaxID=798079 RepID=A0A9W8YCF1_9PLEO|nr:hypothetical protein N0V83_003759 [Neocucurbitaria cava]
MSPQTDSATPSPPLQPIPPLEESRHAHGNGTIRPFPFPSSSLPRHIKATASFSLADVLSEIRGERRGYPLPDPPETCAAVNETSDEPAVVDTSSNQTGVEDKSYEGEVHAHSDELDERYEDEGESTEISDTDVEDDVEDVQEQEIEISGDDGEVDIEDYEGDTDAVEDVINLVHGKIASVAKKLDLTAYYIGEDVDEKQEIEFSGDDGEADIEDYEGDTVEDVMNVPPGKIDPPAKKQDLSAYYVGDNGTDGEDVDEKKKAREMARDKIHMKLRRDLEKEASGRPTSAGDSNEYDYDALLDKVVQDGMDTLPREEDLRLIYLAHGFPAKGSEKVSLILTATGRYIINRIPLLKRDRQALEDSSEDQPAPVSAQDFIPRQYNASMTSPGSSTVDTKTTVAHTPAGKQINFAAHATVPDPFTTTLDDLKQYKGKENSPVKKRRKASSPEEIAELARKAEAIVAAEEDADVVSDQDQEQKQMILYSPEPTFITVIGMLPATVMWTTAAVVAKYSNKAYDAVIEKLTGLKL